MIVDYSFARPGAAQLAAAGVTGVVRYLSNDPTKDLQVDEYADLKAHGIAVALVWETTTTRVLDGANAGTQDATAIAGRLDALGLSADMPVYFAVDYDIPDTAAILATTTGYLAAARIALGRTTTGLYRAGVYGGWTITDRAHLQGYHYLWQTSAWSDGRIHPAARLYQTGRTLTFNGADCDENTAFNTDWGQSFYGPTAPPWPGRYLRNLTPATAAMRGDDVSEWQGHMHERGWTIVVDGAYGPASEATCRAFQQEKGLGVDGIVGPRTWNATWTDPIT